MDYEARRKKVLKAARSLMTKDGRNFTLVDLCKKNRLNRSQLRRFFANKAALLSALDAQTAKPDKEAAEPPAALVEFNIPNENSDPAEETTEPQTAVIEYNVTNENSDPIERRFRVLQRAIALLEARIDAVGPGYAQCELPHEAAGMESPSSVEFQPSENFPPLIVDDADAASQDAAADSCEESLEPPIAIDGPQTIAEAYIASRPVLPGISRDMLDNARASAQVAAERNIRLRSSERKSNTLTLMGAVTVVTVGLIVGFASMGGTARATRAPFSTTSETLANASGVTTINATGAVVADQMTPTTRALRERAEKGDADAQADLALAYLRGDGVVSNAAAAAGWAGLAAAKGQPLSQFILATLYNGGIQPDPHTGFRWMSAAALNGNVKAMHNVAVALVSGSGVEKNPSEAANWFGKAASMGYRDSAFDLAVLYERGEGVAQSTQRALYWYDKAAAAGDKESAQRASLLRFGVPKSEDNLPN